LSNARCDIHDTQKLKDSTQTAQFVAICWVTVGFDALRDL